MPSLTPLLTPQGLTICDKFSTDLADLCNAAGAAGMTPNMISGQLWNMTMLIGFELKDAVDAGAANPPVFTSGVTTIGPGQAVIATVGDLQSATTGEVITLSLAGGYSFELLVGPNPGVFTYTANHLWTGKTVYAVQGDRMRLSVATDGTVSAAVHTGLTWENILVYGQPLTSPAVVTVQGTDKVEVF